MTAEAHTKKVAIVVAHGFEQVELEVPKKALEEAGFGVEIVSPVTGKTVQGTKHMEKGDEFPVDVAISRAKAEEYAALLLPGGVHNPDQLRQDGKVLDFVRHFFEAGKPVAAICHGPWTLIDAGMVSGRRLTSWPSIRMDLCHAGADWSDQAVVVDHNLITSRGPQDLPAFCKELVKAVKAGPGVPEAAAIARLGELIKDIRIAMLTTHEQDGSLRSRPMGTLGSRFDGTLWFFTSISAPKVDEVRNEHAVNVSYADPRADRYISITGRAKVLQDRQKAEELWTPFLKAWFPRGLDDPDLAILKVTVERAEYWDAPAGRMILLYGLAKSLLTGQPYQGEGTKHETIDLEAARKEAAGATHKVDSSKAADTTKAADTSKAVDTTKAEDSTKGADTTKAVDSTKSADTTKAEDSAKPADTTKAVDSTKAAGSTKPSKKRR